MAISGALSLVAHSNMHFVKSQGRVARSQDFHQLVKAEEQVSSEYIVP